MGMVVGQVAIPIPFIGGQVGSVEGRLASTSTANITASAAFSNEAIPILC